MKRRTEGAYHDRKKKVVLVCEICGEKFEARTKVNVKGCKNPKCFDEWERRKRAYDGKKNLLKYHKKRREA